jgi:hypothetical protein
MQCYFFPSNAAANANSDGELELNKYCAVQLTARHHSGPNPPYFSNQLLNLLRIQLLIRREIEARQENKPNLKTITNH